MRKIKIAVAAIAVLMSTGAQAMTIRATELNGDLWDQLKSGRIAELVVEFRKGDVLPVTVKAEGDLVETTQITPSYVTVKKHFFLKMTSSQVFLSFDGSTYKLFNELLSGSLTAGAGTDPSGGVANAIDIVFKAVIK